MEVCCCCCPTGCQRDWKKAQWVCSEGCGGMDNSFTAGRGKLKWPFYYKGTTPTQKMCSVPLAASGPILQHLSCSQTPATSALVAQGPASVDVAGSDGLCLGKGRGALLSRSCLRSSAPALAGLPPARPPAGAHWAGAWPEPLSSFSLCITHKTGSCIPMALLLPVLQGTGTKHSTGPEKHRRQMNLS